MKTKVVNINKTTRYTKKSFLKDGELYIYCGRPKKLSNPYHIGKDGTRKEVIKKFRVFLDSNKIIDELIGFIKDKTPSSVVLGCYCKPLPCHCDVIKERLDNEFNRRLF